MDSLKNTLSIEQELSHRIFKDRVQQLSEAEAQELLIEMHRQTMVKDNLYKELFVNQERDIVDLLFGAER
ncbi:MAG: NblA/ycf18 family protein [Cyanobacteria bacterium J06600_6]